jgi:hypothetical protein
MTEKIIQARDSFLGTAHAEHLQTVAVLLRTLSEANPSAVADLDAVRFVITRPLPNEHPEKMKDDPRT